MYRKTFFETTERGVVIKFGCKFNGILLKDAPEYWLVFQLGNEISDIVEMVKSELTSRGYYGEEAKAKQERADKLMEDPNYCY